MPYEIVKENGKECVKKKSGETIKCHDTHEKALSHLRALEINVKDSALVEMSLSIVKASFNTNEPDPNKRMTFRMSSSDTGRDLADESMSLELFKSFTERIKNNTEIPEPFKSAICENDWCGGMPYLSIAHFRSGNDAKNVPGIIEEVFVDGNILKSKGHCFDNALGRAVFNSLLTDSYKYKSGEKDWQPVRVSIGFLDLKHKHLPQVGGQEFIFTRKSLGEICPLCEQGIGGKIYLDGILVHEAMTRVPMNPRTLMVADLEEKSMSEEIKSKVDDARSIVGDLADALEEKSKLEGILVVKSDGVTVGSENSPSPSQFDECYNPNDGSYDQDCIDKKVASQMVSDRNQMDAVKSQTADKKLLDGVLKSVFRTYKANGITNIPMEVVMEEKMQLGGKDVPVQPFKYDGVESPPHELNKAPVKSDVADEPEDKKDKGKDEKKEGEMKSALDTKFESLKSLLATGNATVDAINTAFSELGTEVEKSYVPAPAAPIDVNNLAEIVRSAVENAVTPLRNEIAILKSQRVDTVSKSAVPASRALNLSRSGLRPEDLIQRSVVPQRKLTKIEEMARKSVFGGAGIPDPLDPQQ